MEFKRTITLTLQSNSPQELNRLAKKVYNTKGINTEDPDKCVSVNVVME
jgi:hypothetical protein